MSDTKMSKTEKEDLFCVFIFWIIFIAIILNLIYQLIIMY